MSDATYIVQMLGDLATSYKEFFSFTSLEDALAFLRREWGDQVEGGFSGEEIVYETPDPEDDRILIWEVAPPYMRVVWHFSGWHWTYDASDVVGGPLDQGVLPGHSKSLYELAMEGY